MSFKRQSYALWLSQCVARAALRVQDVGNVAACLHSAPHPCRATKLSVGRDSLSASGAQLSVVFAQQGRKRPESYRGGGDGDRGGGDRGGGGDRDRRRSRSRESYRRSRSRERRRSRSRTRTRRSPSRSPSRSRSPPRRGCAARLQA